MRVQQVFFLVIFLLSLLLINGQRPGESANAVTHYHRECRRVLHILGNRRVQHIRSAMDKPRLGETTSVIMVSPLPAVSTTRRKSRRKSCQLKKCLPLHSRVPFP